MKHKIKGKTCSLVLDLPNYMDDTTRDVLVNIFSYCLDEESRDKVLDAVRTLLTQIRKLINSLKKTKKHTAEIERGIREFLGTQLNHGFSIGFYYAPGEEGPEIIDVLVDKFNYSRLLSKLPQNKKKTAEGIFYCLDLASLAFETGLMLSYYLSEELVEQNQKELRKMSSYIG